MEREAEIAVERELARRAKEEAERLKRESEAADKRAAEEKKNREEIERKHKLQQEKLKALEEKAGNKLAATEQRCKMLIAEVEKLKRDNYELRNEVNRKDMDGADDQQKIKKLRSRIERMIKNHKSELKSVASNFRASLQAKCRNAHPLVTHRTSSYGWTCDVCKRKFRSGTWLYGCRKCNFDKCVDCMAAGKQ
jgi:hypothetical protein